MQCKSLTRQGVSSSLYQWCSGKSKISHLSKVNNIILSTMQNCKKGNISAGCKWLRCCCFFFFFQKLQNGHNLQSFLMQVHKIDSKSTFTEWDGMMTLLVSCFYIFLQLVKSLFHALPIMFRKWLIILKILISPEGKNQFVVRGLAVIKKHHNLVLYIPIETEKPFMWINCLSTV